MGTKLQQPAQKQHPAWVRPKGATAGAASPVVRDEQLP